MVRLEYQCKINPICLIISLFYLRYNKCKKQLIIFVY